MLFFTENICADYAPLTAPYEQETILNWLLPLPLVFCINSVTGICRSY
jgi:hypothetical protein